MSEGPLGGPRPLADSEIVVYSRFRLGGNVDGDDTDKLQEEDRFPNELSAELEHLRSLAAVDVRFHPAGFIVGVEVFTSRDDIGRDEVDEIVDVSEEYLEDTFGVSAELEAPDRREPAVEIRAE